MVGCYYKMDIYKMIPFVINKYLEDLYGDQGIIKIKVYLGYYDIDLNVIRNNITSYMDYKVNL